MRRTLVATVAVVALAGCASGGDSPEVGEFARESLESVYAYDWQAVAERTHPAQLDELGGVEAVADCLGDRPSASASLPSVDSIEVAETTEVEEAEIAGTGLAPPATRVVLDDGEQRTPLTVYEVEGELRMALDEESLDTCR